MVVKKSIPEGCKEIIYCYRVRISLKDGMFEQESTSAIGSFFQPTPTGTPKRIIYLYGVEDSQRTSPQRKWHFHQ